MIYIKSIQLTNFLSHDKTSLDLNNSTRILLSGKSGSGKSSIAEAVLFGLFGRGRVDNRSLVKKGKKFAEVTLVVLKGTKEYKIKRRITPVGKHELSLLVKTDKEFMPAEISGIKEIQNFIEKEIVKCSYVLFVNSVMSPQGSAENFINQTAGKRKDLIMEMIGTEKHDEMYELAKTKLREVEDNLLSSQTSIKEKELSILDKETISKNLLVEKENQKKSKEELDKIDKKLMDINTEIANNQKVNETISEKKEQLSVLESDKSLLETHLEGVDRRLEELNKINIEEIKKDYALLCKIREEKKELEKDKEKLNKWNTKYMEALGKKPPEEGLADRIKEVNKKMIAVMTQKMPICSKCGAPYVEYENKKATDLKTLEDELGRLMYKQEIYNNSKKEFDLLINAIGKQPIFDSIKYNDLVFNEGLYKDSELQYAQLSNLENRKGELMEDKKLSAINLEKLTKSITEITEFLKNVKTGPDLSELLRNFNGAKDWESRKYHDTTIRIGGMEEALRIIEKAEKEIGESKKGIESLEYDHKCLELIKEAFGANGIRLILIDNILPQLEDKINKVLGRLSDFRIKLDTQKVNVTGEKTLEGLFITIINSEGEEMDVNSLSGGEQIRVNFSIFEGLASLQKCNFRILDETIQALDSDSLDSFSRVVYSLFEGDKQLIAISHIPEIQSMFENKVNIIKINGTSKIL